MRGFVRRRETSGFDSSDMGDEFRTRRSFGRSTASSVSLSEVEDDSGFDTVIDNRQRSPKPSLLTKLKAFLKTKGTLHARTISLGEEDVYDDHGRKLNPKRSWLHRRGQWQSYRRGGDNALCNQKYSLLTFLPMVLFEQFSMFYNLFYLAIAVSQLIPALKVGFIWTYFGPLSFVVFASIAKEASDEFLRIKRDREVNNCEYSLLVKSEDAVYDMVEDLPATLTNASAKIVRVRSRDIRVGDILVLECDERVPADCILLRALSKTEENGDSLFVRTDQLDGETDWKVRRAVHATQKLTTDADVLFTMESVFAEAPKKEIYDFTGNFNTANGGIEPLSLENTLWANTVIASGTALALVIYTGKESRSVLNTSQPRSKIGKLDFEVNLMSKCLFGLLSAFSFTLTALRGFYQSWWLYLLRYFLLLSYIIPISMRVSLDMARLVYSYLMQQDSAKMPNCVVRSSDLPEELGRVEVLLSDKTGTLTQNDMSFKKLHLGTVLFGRDSHEDLVEAAYVAFGGSVAEIVAAGEKAVDGSAAILSSSGENPRRGRMVTEVTPVGMASGVISTTTKTTAVGAANEAATSYLNEGGPRMSKTQAVRRLHGRVKEALLAIALAHNVTPAEEHGQRTMQAASPDEVALVKFVESLGLILLERTQSMVRLRTPTGDILSYEILFEFPFTSEAKRMGIVVREESSKTVELFLKGADVVMSKLVRYNDWLDEESGNLAREGLRTLVFAKRTLDEESFRAFVDMWSDARTQTHNRKEAMLAAQSSLERNMDLLALTGVEDKLQPNVREVLEKLRHAGIRIWMLTGDKVETAMCIAVSSRLAERSQRFFTMTNLTSRSEVSKSLTALRRGNGEDVLVIDGTTLETTLNNFPEEFIELACKAPSAIACRCSPTQKATIAKLLQIHTKMRIAAIGDGGNDVSMIQQANVGLGIPGKEGKQASLAADFSIVSFSHLTRLLLWHGRNSYKRSARMAQFVMHRGLIIAVVQIVHCALFFYAAVSVYDGWILVGYATIFTMLPVFSLVLDEDVNEWVADTYPELYRELRRGRSLNIKSFLIWVFKSIYQGTAIMVISVYILWDDHYFTTLHLSAISFTALILTELLMVAFEVHTWHWFMVAAEVCSMFAYLSAILLLRNVFDPTVIFTWQFLYRVVIVTVFSCLPVTIGKFLQRKLAPPSYSKLA